MLRMSKSRSVLIPMDGYSTLNFSLTGDQVLTESDTEASPWLKLTSDISDIYGGITSTLGRMRTCGGRTQRSRSYGVIQSDQTTCGRPLRLLVITVGSTTLTTVPE